MGRTPAGQRPAGDLVALEPGAVKEAVRPLQLLPGVVRIDLLDQSQLATAVQERAFLEAQAVAGDVLRTQVGRPLDRRQPGSSSLQRYGVDQTCRPR